EGGGPAVMKAQLAVVARAAGMCRFDRIAFGVEIDGFRFPARADDRLEQAVCRGARELEREGRGDMEEDRQKGEGLRGAEARPKCPNSVSICLDRPHKHHSMPAGERKPRPPRAQFVAAGRAFCLYFLQKERQQDRHGRKRWPTMKTSHTR